MGFISDASVDTANSSKFTLSMWAQFVDATTYVPIMEFGGTSGNKFMYDQLGSTDQTSFKSCRIFKDNQPGKTGKQIFVLLAAPYGSFNSAAILAGLSGDSDNPLYTSISDQVDAGTFWTPSVALVAGSDNDPDSAFTAAIAPGTWFHLFVSVDLSVKDGLDIIDNGLDPEDRYDDPNNFKRAWFLINGLDFGLGHVAEPEFAPGTLPTTLPTNGYCGTRIYSSSGDSIDSTDNAHSISYGHASYEVPPWTIAFNANSLAMPVVSANAADNPGLRVADVQIWMGTYIDGSDASNLAKFISGGHPVDPDIALAAFGARSYFHKGPASDFVTNEGSGGSLTKTGTISDFSPGP